MLWLIIVLQIVAVLGLAALIVGAVLTGKNNKKTASCTKRATGTVVDTQRDKDVKGGKGVRGTSRFSPVFEYTVEGVTHKAVAAFTARNKNDIKIGDTVELLYDPTNPEHCITEGSKKGNAFNTLLIVLGLVFIVAAVVVSLVLKINAFLIF